MSELPGRVGSKKSRSGCHNTLASFPEQLANDMGSTMAISSAVSSEALSTLTSQSMVPLQ